MVRTTTRPTFRNQLLLSLAKADLDLISPVLTLLALPLRKSLQMPGAVIADVYFVENGIVSVVTVATKDAKRVEAGLFGRGGVTGIEIILANDRSPHDVYMQVAGNGYRLRAAELAKAMAASETFADRCFASPAAS